jgi:hypothetical protein
MIPLKCILEYAIVQGQSYDFGKDFSSFQRALDGTTEQVKQKFESTINSQLKGKRVRARASRGYKQFEKDYEFDVSRITIDDYYDNFVVVAHDESKKTKSGRAKEYFLKPSTKIQIIGQASGGDAVSHDVMKSSHGQAPDASKQHPAPALPSPTLSPEQPVKEDKGIYEAYSIDEIENDIKPWMKLLIKNPKVNVREYAKSLGWKKAGKNGTSTAVYDLTIPVGDARVKINEKNINMVLERINKLSGNKGKLIPIKFNNDDNCYKVRIKKTIPSTPGNKGSDTDKKHI